MRKIGVLLSCLALLLGLCSCGGNDGDAVTVQSVSSITGGGYIGAYNRFAGIVSARSETVIKKDDSRIINEIKVEAGDHVEKGQVLFTYDTQAMQLSLEKARLEVDPQTEPVPCGGSPRRCPRSDRPCRSWYCR